MGVWHMGRHGCVTYGETWVCESFFLELSLLVSDLILVELCRLFSPLVLFLLELALGGGGGGGGGGCGWGQGAG